MMNQNKLLERRIRSYVRREGRITPSQRQALEKYWNEYGLENNGMLVDFAKVFGRQAPRIIEIGFGTGDGLLALAQQMPECDFVGIDVYRPGVGNLIIKLKKAQITNVRIFCADVVDVFEKAIPEESIENVLLFFPDPWPKKRHHKRRLVQTLFIELVKRKLKAGGHLYLATDWEDYAHHMMAVLSVIPELLNQAGQGCFATRSPLRPPSKFEQRGLRQGHKVWDLIFTKEGELKV